MPATLYAGPGKVNFNGVALQAADTNGLITAKTVQTAEPVAVAMYGRVGYVQGNVIETLEFTPFDNWGLLPVLFPPYLGVSAGAVPGALAIGVQPHNPGGAADAAATIWTPDGRLYTFPHCAITRHPDLHLGASRPLFGPLQITNLLASGASLGSAGAFHRVLEAGAADPGGAFLTSDVARGAWTGVWGTSPGFGGAAGDSPLEAEDGWTLSAAVKYSPLTVQGLVRAYKLDEVSFLVKGRPYGPTHTELTQALGINSGRALGARIPTPNAADLVLSGPNARVVTLKNADLVGAGFDFGGAKLGSAEIGFVSGMTFNAGVAQPLLTFSV